MDADIAEMKVEINHLQNGYKEHDLTIDALKESTIRTEEHMKTFVANNKTMLDAIHKQGETLEKTDIRVTNLETFKYGVILAWGMIVAGATVIWKVVTQLFVT